MKKTIAKFFKGIEDNYVIYFPPVETLSVSEQSKIGELLYILEHSKTLEVKFYDKVEVSEGKISSSFFEIIKDIKDDKYILLTCFTEYKDFYIAILEGENRFEKILFKLKNYNNPVINYLNLENILIDIVFYDFVSCEMRKAIHSLRCKIDFDKNFVEPFCDELKRILTDALSIENLGNAWQKIKEKEKVFLSEVYEPIFLEVKEQVLDLNITDKEVFGETFAKMLNDYFEKLDYEGLSKKYDIKVDSLRLSLELQVNAVVCSWEFKKK